jgi:hypothetical protein
LVLLECSDERPCSPEVGLDGGDVAVDVVLGSGSEVLIGLEAALGCGSDELTVLEPCDLPRVWLLGSCVFFGVPDESFVCFRWPAELLVAPTP